MFEVERSLVSEWVLDIRRQVQAAQAAATIVWQGLFAARVGGLDAFAVCQVVLFIDPVNIKYAGLRRGIRAFHDQIPDFTGTYFPVYPQAVVALIRTLLLEFVVWFADMHQLEVGVIFYRLHERISHAHRDVEIIQLAALLFGGDEFFDIGMADVQDSHLRATTRAGGFDRFARAIKYPHIRNGARCAASVPLTNAPFGRMSEKL